MRKILFDARWIGEHGIGRFAYEIAKKNPDFIHIKSNLKPSSIFDIVFVTFYLIFHKGIYFSPGYNPPLFFLKRSIITIHDLNHIDVDYNSSLLKRIYYSVFLKRACRKSLKILTVSEFSKRRICEWAKVDPAKIIVVGNGVSDEFNPSVIAYKDDYILIVGNRKSHKNDLRSLEAFARANISNNIKLFFIGISSTELNKKIKELNLNERVVFKGKVSNDELASLYKGAILLLFPSLYEGFGLPVIESMSCGTAVVTSNTTSLPEVAGNAALLVDPMDVNEISAAIEKIYFNPELKKSLIANGFKQCRKYTWDKTIEQVNSVLKMYR